MNKNITIRSLILFFILPCALLGLGGCPKEKDHQSNNAEAISATAPQAKSLALIVRLSQAKDSNYERLVNDFLEEHKSDGELKLKLLRKRNDEGQNPLHFLMAKGSSNLKPAKMVFDQDAKLYLQKDSYGGTPLDSFASDISNLKNLSKLKSLKAELSVDFCQRLKDQDFLITKMCRLPPSPERDEALIFAWKNGGSLCVEKMGENYETAADILVADSSHGAAFYNLLVAEGLSKVSLDNSRQKKQTLVLVQQNQTAGQPVIAQSQAALPPVVQPIQPTLPHNAPIAQPIQPALPHNAPIVQANLQAAPAHLFKLAAINDYKPEYDAQKLPQLEAFLVAVKQAIDAGTIATPIRYAAGKHQIGGHEHKIKLGVLFISAQKIVILLNEVVYAETDQFGIKTPKIKAALDALNGQHLVLREANTNEFAIYKQLEQKPQNGVVAIHSTLQDSANLVFMKRYNGGDLFEILDEISAGNESAMSEAVKRQLGISLIDGVKNIHAIEIQIINSSGALVKVKLSHRDLKPDNIFCEHFGTAQFSCAIGDFDMAAEFKEITGTRGYFDPQLLDFIWVKQGGTEADLIKLNSEQGQKFDIWALGLILTSILGSEYQQPVELDAIVRMLLANNRVGQKAFKEKNFKEIAEEWFLIKNSNQEKATLRVADIARLMLQKDPARRPDATQALALLNKNVDYVMSQPFSAAKNIAAKKLVGGIFHYCYIDQTDIVHCKDLSTPEDKAQFSGLDQVAVIPTAIANIAVKDLIAGPFNTCAIMTDDTLQCFGRNNPAHDLRLLNGSSPTKVLVNQETVITIDQTRKVKSSPKRPGFKGLSLDPAKIIWSATNDFLYSSDDKGSFDDLALINNTIKTNSTLLSNIIAPWTEQQHGRAKAMVGSNEHVYGLTKNGSLFSSEIGNDLKTFFSFDLETHTFKAITMAHGLDKTSYEGSPWVHTDKDITLASGQKIKAGAWLGGNANDPVFVIGDADGVYEEVVIGQRYRCLKQSGTYYCDH